MKKNKDCIEFSMYSMVTTYRPYQEDTEIAITGMVPGRDIRTASAPFDIPCEVVVVPKREFEKLQTENEELKKKLEQEVKILNGALQEWKEITGCPTPIAAKTLIESGMSYEHGYHEVQEENRKLTDEVKSWLNVTGYATPEDYLSAKIRTVYIELEPSNVTWRDATGCDTPEEAKSRIKGLENAVRLTDKTLLGELERAIDAWQKATGCSTPEEAEKTIKSFLLTTLMF